MYETVIKGTRKSGKSDRQEKKRLIDLDRLNVIGENHLDLRTVEKNYLDYIYGYKKYNYWTETTFPERHDEGRLEGDPYYLRFQYTIAAISEQADELKKQVGEGTIIDSFSLDYLAGCINIEKLKTQMEDPQNSLNMYLNHLSVRGKDLLRIMQSVKEDMEEFPCVSYCYNQNTRKKDKMTRLLNDMIGACSIIREQLQIRENEDAYRRKRSYYMHLAANESKALCGVWKVGDKHREDMEELDHREYNLISRDEFYHNINHYEPPRQNAAIERGMQKTVGQTGMKKYAALYLNKKPK